MPSPFPGMDPYTESPELWSDFHNNLASELRAQLNRVIQLDYFARLTSYDTYEMIEEGQTSRLCLDAPFELASTPTAVVPSPMESRIVLDVPLRLHRVEIRATANQELVTVIEILSPVNKRPSHDAYRNYQRKRRDLLRSPVHLLELDLLRGGERPPLEDPVPEAPYYVVLSRADDRPVVKVWPIRLSDRLPVLPVPLLEPDPDSNLDLAVAVANVYERGAYTSQIDYRQPPPPPLLSEAETTWLDGLLRAQSRR